MFGSRGKKRQRVLEEMERARPALESNDLAAVKGAHDALVTAWVEAGAKDNDAWELSYKLDQRAADLKRRGLELQELERRVLPCVRCTGREFAVSEAFRFKELDVPTGWRTSPRVRFWVCRACGAADLVVEDLAELKDPFF